MQALRQQQLRKQRQRRFAIGGGLAALAAAIIAVVIAVTTTGGTKTAAKATTTTTKPAATTTTTSLPPVSVPLLDAPKNVGCPALNGSSPHYTHFQAKPPMCISPSKTYTATMVTNLGTIVIKLDTAASSSAVNNFVFLSGYHFYDGTEFHRIVTGFVDQGGDPTGTGTGGPGYHFDGGKPASTKVYTAGARAMANNGGNPATDGSQFFIVVGKGGQELGSPDYTYFGNVTKGLEVVDAINKDGSDTTAGTPTKIDKIEKVTISAS